MSSGRSDKILVFELRKRPSNGSFVFIKAPSPKPLYEIILRQYNPRSYSIPQRKAVKGLLIIVAAYLELCSCCGKTARITLASGESTKAFHSRKLGREIVTFLKEKGRITAEEHRYLHSSLNESTLDEENPFLDRMFLAEEALTKDDENSGEGTPRQWLM